MVPPRTDYDYSPLDLAPPGQRRRRQLVAAAVGGLSVLLLGAIAVFGYLLLRDEPVDEDQDDVIAAQTELAESRATIAAQETIVAQAAAEQTAQVQGPAAATPPTDPAAAADEGGAETPAASTRPPAETPADAASDAALTPEELTALLPAEDAAPAGLDIVENTTRDQAGVVEALGGSRQAEQNLETWGWTGNVERAFTPSDPEALEAGATYGLVVSIHGFATPDAAAEALPFFSEILVEGGYEEAEAPNLGDNARLLQTVNEDGATTVALYIQNGTVLYRIGGASTGGDPTADITDMATALLEG